MSDPTRHIQEQRCFVQIQGIILNGTKIIAGVIKHHNDHNDTPKGIYGVDALIIFNRNGCHFGLIKW